MPRLLAAIMVVLSGAPTLAQPNPCAPAQHVGWSPPMYSWNMYGTELRRLREQIVHCVEGGGKWKACADEALGRTGSPSGGRNAVHLPEMKRAIKALGKKWQQRSMLASQRCADRDISYETVNGIEEWCWASYDACVSQLQKAEQVMDNAHLLEPCLDNGNWQQKNLDIDAKQKQACDAYTAELERKKKEDEQKKAAADQRKAADDAQHREEIEQQKRTRDEVLRKQREEKAEREEQEQANKRKAAARQQQAAEDAHRSSQDAHRGVNEAAGRLQDALQQQAEREASEREEAAAQRRQENAEAAERAEKRAREEEEFNREVDREVAEEEGSLAFTSSPTGATVSIGRRTPCQTPCSFKVLPATLHYRVQLTGYVTLNGTVTTVAGRTVPVDVVLTALATSEPKTTHETNDSSARAPSSQSCSLDPIQGSLPSSRILSLGERPRPHHPAAALKACERGDRPACHWLAWANSSQLGDAAYDAVSAFDVQSYGKHDIPQARRASALWQKACDLGEGYFCWLLGNRASDEATSEQYGIRYDRTRASRLYDRACRLRFNCADAGKLAATCQDFDRALAYHDSGCRGGEPRDCKSAEALRSDGKGSSAPSATRKADRP